MFGPGSTGSDDSCCGGANGLLLRFLSDELGCSGLAAEPWAPSTLPGSSGACRQRRLTYATPLTLKQRLLLPLGPPAVPNAEQQQVETDASSGAVTVRCSVASSGVPFADCFRNELEWRLEGAADGSGGTRALLTAACVFHRPVLGPLRGQIEGESLQGMSSTYARVARLLQQHFSVGASSSDGGSLYSRGAGATGVSNASRSTALSSSAAGSSSSSSSSSVPGQSRAAAGSADSDNDDGVWAAAQARVAPHLASAASAPAVLQQVQELWPAWAAAGFRPRPGQAPQGPCPEEAAVALQVVARRALALPPQRRIRELARHRCVKGLVQALRLEAPSAGSDGSGGGGDGAGGPRSASGVAAALWALAVLGGSIYWEGEADALCALLPACRFSSLKKVSEVCWALGTARHHTPHLPLLEQQAAQLLERRLAELEQADSRPAGSASASQPGQQQQQQQQAQPPSINHIASLVWGLASLGHRPTLLLPLLPAALQAHQPPGGSSGSMGEAFWKPPTGDAAPGPGFGPLCTLAWSLAVGRCLQYPAAASVAAQLAGAAEGVPAGGAKWPQLLQLHQFRLALQAAAATEEEVPEGQGRCATAALFALCISSDAAPLLEAAAAAWKAEGRHRGSKTVSACQADVAGTARAGLGLAVVEEHSVSGWSVDIAVPARRLAIEVDGPTHFCRNSLAPGQAPRPLGATLLKHRLLHLQGWAVAAVCSEEWEGLRGAEAKRRALAAAVAAAEAGQAAG